LVDLITDLKSIFTVTLDYLSAYWDGWGNIK